MPIAAEPDESVLPELGISTEKVRFVIVKARQFDAKESDSDPDEGSNASDDGEADVLEDKPEDDAVEQELISYINGLDEEERANLVALAWVGRETYGTDEWAEALETARSEHGKRTAQYLLGLPLLGDYLADGLAEFGEDFDDETDDELDAEEPSEEDNS
jgi:DNA-directed RNA polymerase specialized sigma subunit